MKIAILGSNCPPSGGGGVTTAHLNLFQTLQSIGTDVRFFTFQDSEVIEKEIIKGRIIRNGASRTIRQGIKIICNIIFRLLDRCERAYQTADILQSFWGVHRINRELRHFQPDWIIIPDHSGPGVFLSPPSKSKIILIAHHNPTRFLDQPQIPVHSKKDANVAIWLEELGLEKVDIIVTPSKYMHETFKKTYRYQGPVITVPNVLDQNLLLNTVASQLRTKMNLPETAPIIYIPAAGNPFKGSHMVASAIDSIIKEYGSNPVGFYLATTTGIPAILRNELNKKSNEKVRFYFGDHETYPNHLSNVKACSVGVSLTLLESYGMTILESQCLGVPFVAFDAQATPEVIKDGENGFLVPPNDVALLAKQTINLISNRLAESKHLGPQLAEKHNVLCKRIWSKIFSKNSYLNQDNPISKSAIRSKDLR